MYSGQVDSIKALFWPRIEELFEWLREEAQILGLTPGPLMDFTDCEYSWAFDAGTLGVQFTLCESMEHEGTEDGVNFELRITATGGRMLSVISPCNYTPECWTLDRDELADRLSIIEKSAAGALKSSLEMQTTGLVRP